MNRVEAGYFYRELDLRIPRPLLSTYMSFLENSLVAPYREKVESVVRAIRRGNEVLMVRYKDEKGNPFAEVVVEAGERPRVWVTPLSPRVRAEEADEAIRAVELATLSFLESKSDARIYFVFVKRMKFVKEGIETVKQKMIQKLFFGNMFLLFMISLLFAWMIFMVAGMYAFIIIPLSNLFLLVFADKIVESLGDWKLSEDNRHVYLVCYSMPVSEYKEFMRLHYPRRFEIKRRIYEETLAKGKDIDMESVIKVFQEMGIPVDDRHRVSIIKRDVYGMVKRVFSSYGLPIPRVVVWNIALPNAAATGIVHKLSVVLITSGLLAKLDNDEIEAVIGHEASHVKNHDPFMLFIISLFEYALRIWVFMTFWYIMANLLIELAYLFIALTALYFIAKFFEARADLEAAYITGKPSSLARALKKIGLRKLLLERYPRVPLEGWLSMDPHPPVSWRIMRLERLSPFVRERPFLASARDCVMGLIRSLIR